MCSCEQVWKAGWWSEALSAWVTFPLTGGFSVGHLTQQEMGNRGCQSRWNTCRNLRLGQNCAFDIFICFATWNGELFFDSFFFSNCTPSFQVEGMAFCLISSCSLWHGAPNNVCVYNSLLVDWFLLFPCGQGDIVCCSTSFSKKKKSGVSIGSMLIVTVSLQP